MEPKTMNVRELAQVEKIFPIMKSSSGRPLGERNAPESAKTGVEFEMVRCPYSGSRAAAGLPMNVSALKEIQAEWSKVLDVLLWTRNCYSQRNDKTSLNLLDHWRISQMLQQLPSYFYSKGVVLGKETSTVSNLIASTFKVFTGVASSLRSMIFFGYLIGQYDHSATFTGDEIFKFIEKLDFLVGRDEVCAGSEKQIRLVLNYLVEGSDIKGSFSNYEALENIDYSSLETFSSITTDLQVLQAMSHVGSYILVNKFKESCFELKPPIDEKLKSTIQNHLVPLGYHVRTQKPVTLAPDNARAIFVWNLSLAWDQKEFKKRFNFIVSDAPELDLSVPVNGLRFSDPRVTQIYENFLRHYLHLEEQCHFMNQILQDRLDLWQQAKTPSKLPRAPGILASALERLAAQLT